MAEVEENARWLSSQDKIDALEDPDVRFLVSYWSSAAGGRPAPRRRDIDPPLDLPGYLPTTIMFDVERRGDALTYRYRLLGTRLVDFAGREVRGMTIEEAFGGQFSQRDIDIYEEVVRNCRCYVGHRISLIESRRAYEHYTRVVMPVLGDTSGEVDFVWSWLKFDGSPRVSR